MSSTGKTQDTQGTGAISLAGQFKDALRSGSSRSVFDSGVKLDNLVRNDNRKNGYSRMLFRSNIDLEMEAAMEAMYADLKPSRLGAEDTLFKSEKVKIGKYQALLSISCTRGSLEVSIGGYRKEDEAEAIKLMDGELVAIDARMIELKERRAAKDAINSLKESMKREESWV
jgi:hypothetical protein